MYVFSAKGSFRSRSPFLAWGGVLAVLILMIHAGCGQSRTPRQFGVPSRVISLVPGVTETMYALGAQDQLVAVTDYCRYPVEATQKRKVGGYLDPSFETILSLRPDLVLLMKEHETVKRFLTSAGIAYTEIDNHNLAAIGSSIQVIGHKLGRVKESDSLSAQFAQACSSTTVESSGRLPRVLVCVERAPLGSGVVTRMYGAGSGTFYDDIVRIAGGVNALGSTGPQYPQLGSEGVIKTAPDIIIDILTSHAPLDSATVTRDWYRFALVPAIVDSAVHCLAGDYVNIPGPRIVRLVGDFRRVVAQWHTAVGEGRSGDR